MKKLTLTLVLLLLSWGVIEASQETVVGIHGFLVSPRSLLPTRRALYCVGFDVLLWEYQSREATTCRHADDLIKTLQCIAEQKPGVPIHFVTHSVGAWVLRCALNHPNCPQEAKMGRAVLVAPPNQGSILAREVGSKPPIRWALGKESGLELQTYSACDVIRCLGHFPACMPILVLAGKQGTHWFREPNDGFLTVCETKLETPHHFLVLPLTHGKLLSNGYSLSLMRNFLLCGNISE